MIHVNELGGLVPIHDANMRSTNPAIFVAGDASGIEEATTAILGGRIAGARAYESLFGKSDKAEQVVIEAREELRTLRSGSTGERIRWGRDRLIKEVEKC
jgi:sarcosine oxidase subunit alpha